MKLTKPSVEAALRASIKKNDKGFTAKDMQKAWGFKTLGSAKNKIKDMVNQGIYECVGKYRSLDVLGKTTYCALYRVVKKKKA